jgi:hypothetical protein
MDAASGTSSQGRPRSRDWGSVAPDPRFCLDHADQGIRASPALRPASAGGPDHDPLPRLRGDVALNVRRHRSLRESMNPARPRGLLGRPNAAGQCLLAETARLPRGGGAAVQSLADHGPFTRSAACSSVDHRHSTPPKNHRGENDKIPRGDTAARRYCDPIARFGRKPDAARRDPTPFDSLENLRPATTARQLGGRTPGQGRSPSRASSPTSHRRPTPSSARIRFTDHPCSTCRARR